MALPASRPRTPAPPRCAPWPAAASRRDGDPAGRVGSAPTGRVDLQLDEWREALGQGELSCALSGQGSPSPWEHGDVPAVAERARLAQQKAQPHRRPPRMHTPVACKARIQLDGERMAL